MDLATLFDLLPFSYNILRVCADCYRKHHVVFFVYNCTMSVLSCYFLQGITRLLLTKIPFFREVIISSFQCDACGYSDCGIQSGSRVQDKGVRYTLTVKGTKVWYFNDICELQLVISFVKCQF